jgi:hypothetical protein
MSDGAYLLLAAGVVGIFVVAVLVTNPDRPSKWWTRNPK